MQIREDAVSFWLCRSSRCGHESLCVCFVCEPDLSEVEDGGAELTIEASNFVVILAQNIFVPAPSSHAR